MSINVCHGDMADLATVANLVWRRVSPEGEPASPDDSFAAWFALWATDHASTHVPFVAFKSGAAVGIGWLAVSQRVPGPDRQRRSCGDIQSVYVLPERRNDGIGSELVRAMLAYADAQGLEHVTVHSSERAISLYRRIGFTHNPELLYRQCSPSQGAPQGEEVGAAIVPFHDAR